MHVCISFIYTCEMYTLSSFFSFFSLKKRFLLSYTHFYWNYCRIHIHVLNYTIILQQSFHFLILR
jgi:hypothetical protein